MTVILILVFTGAGLLAGLITGLCIALYIDEPVLDAHYRVNRQLAKDRNALRAKLAEAQQEVERLLALVKKDGGFEDIARHWYEQEVVTAWDKKVNQLEAESLTRENEIKRLYATLVQLREDQKYTDMGADHAEQKAAQRDAAYTSLARECEGLRAANRALCDKYNELLRNQ